MNKSQLIDDYDQWTRHGYLKRVRGTAQPTYLWGSSGVVRNVNFTTPLILHVHNDLFGEPIHLSTQAAGNSTAVAYGTLQPGECFSLPVQDISGVIATCDLESTIACAITTH